MTNEVKTIKVDLHPEALMDRPYETHHFQKSEYRPLKYPFDDIKCGEMQLFAQTFGNDALFFQIISDRVFRLRISPDKSAFYQSVTEKLGLIQVKTTNAEFSFFQQDEAIHAESPYMRFRYDRKGHDFTFTAIDDTVLLKSLFGGVQFGIKPAQWSGHRFFAEFDFRDEVVFGFGGRTMPPCRNGQTMDFFNMKVGRRKGDYGGFSIPFYLSSKGYGLFLNNPWPHLYFDMGKSDPEKWFMLSPGGEFDLFIIFGPEFSTIMNEFTAIVGRIPVPDKSLLGFWCSSLTFVNDQQVLGTVDRLHSEGYPCDLVVLDGPWRGGKNFVKQYTLGHQYPSNDVNWHEDFGDGPKMIRELKKRNVKTSLHLNSRNFHPDTIEMGLKEGFLRKHDEEVVVNLSEPFAVMYYESLLEPRIKEGVDIWWTDHSDRVGGEIAKGLPSRNLFGSLWNRLICEQMARHGKRNHICLTRGSGIGGQKYAIPWPGDTLNGIEAFEPDIWFSMNIGLAGFPVFSADLGGFTLGKNPDEIDKDQIQKEIFDDENICRRLCQSLFFVPCPRIHNNWDAIAKLPWFCSEKAAELYKKVLEIRYQLTPYIYSYVVNAALTGEPIIRPMVYHDRDDNRTYQISDQFYMGEYLLIAPVTQRAVLSRNVYIPKGKWVNFWTDEEVEGPADITVQTPLFSIEGLPVFVKKGAVITKQPFSLTLDNEPPNELTFDIYPKKNNIFRIYEGKTSTITVEYTMNDRELNLTIDNTTKIIRTYGFNIHNLPKNCRIKIDSKETSYALYQKVTKFRTQVKSGDKKQIQIEFFGFHK